MYENDYEKRLLREISPDQIPGACVAFLIVHEDCGDTVEFVRLADNLVCHCERHGETFTYRVLE